MQNIQSLSARYGITIQTKEQRFIALYWIKTLINYLSKTQHFYVHDKAPNFGNNDFKNK